MPTLRFLEENFPCDRAQKGKDYIRLLDSDGNIVFLAEGISDFSAYSLSGGEWETPYVVMAPTVGASATRNGGIVALSLSKAVKLENGLQVNFTAPCNCSVTEYLQIGGENYTVVDALGRCVTGKGGLWMTGAVLSVTLDVDKKFAYIQSARGGLVLDETAELLGLEPGTTMDDALIAIGSELAGKVVFQSGSYVGTGGAGATNANSLSFDFIPKYIKIVYKENSSGVVSKIIGDYTLNELFTDSLTEAYASAPGAFFYNGGDYGMTQSGYAKRDATGKTISWYSTAESPLFQFNEDGVTYHYLAIGVGASGGGAVAASIEDLPLPEVTTADDGKILQVVNGQWKAVPVADSAIKTFIDNYIQNERSVAE